MNKKIVRRNMCLIIILSSIIIGACTNHETASDNIKIDNSFESESLSEESKVAENEESAEDIIKRDEERFLELFAECYKKYEEEGLGVEFRYDELASIYHKYPDNEMMENLFLFCSVCANYNTYCIVEMESQLDFTKDQAAKINPNYDGPYAEEVIGLAIGLLGAEYASRATAVIEQKKNYEQLSLQDKVDIVNRISNNGGESSDSLWQQIADEYGISKNHVSKIYTDIEVLKSWGQENASEQEKIEYDAYLEYGDESVLIGSSKDSLRRYMEALVDGNDGTIDELEKRGEISYTTKGTKCNVIDRELTMCKVKILDGLYKGNTVWVLAESVKEK